jgi:hypothetical protein
MFVEVHFIGSQIPYTGSPGCQTPDNQKRFADRGIRVSAQIIFYWKAHKMIVGATPLAGPSPIHVTRTAGF